MVEFSGVNYTLNGKEPVTGEEFYVLGASLANDQHYDPAAAFLRRAEQLGDQEAMIKLAFLYRDMLLPCSLPPLHHALEHLGHASDLGHPYAQYLIAEIYYRDYKDDVTAAAFYQACMDNPRRADHPLGTLMESSDLRLNEIHYAQSQRREQERRDAVNPPRPQEWRF
jgi:TPR repeat protein